MITRAILVVAPLFALAGCGGSSPGPQASAPAVLASDGRLHGQGMSIPLPAGWRLTDRAILDKVGPGSVGMQQATPPPGWIPASVLAQRLPANQVLDEKDASTCTSLAQGVAESLGASVVSAAIAASRFGDTCQFEVSGGGRKVLGIVLHGTSASWVEACTTDLRAAHDADICPVTLAGWRWD